MNEEEDFISLYLEYTARTESPTFFHRWTGLTSLSAYLGRQVYYKFGHFTLYPNLYVMLMGSPGTKKSSAIKIGAKLLKLAGYTNFAAKKTRQEKFLEDLADNSERIARANSTESDMLDHNLWGDSVLESISTYTDRPPAEVFIAADEWNNFMGAGNMEFATILGELWDFEDVYPYKLKNSKSIFIPYPTVTILGGNTPTGFASCFPPEAIGQGFLSRLLLIYGEDTGRKIFPPPEPDIGIQTKLIELLHKIKGEVLGEIIPTQEGLALLDHIYETWQDIADPRFEHYSNRRLTHLIKLCMSVTVSRLSTKMSITDIIYGNTVLTFAEQLMPKALGEFGKAKHSEVTHKIMTAIDNTKLPISLQEVWKLVHTDLDSRQQMSDILANLQAAEKIQVIAGGKFLPIKKVISESTSGTVDWNILTEVERNLT